MSKCAENHEEMLLDKLRRYIDTEEYKYEAPYITKGDVEVIIPALEKQIPKKVNKPPCNTCEKELCDCECKHFAVTYRDNYRCPTCDSNGVYISEYEFRYDYCPNCGQKLDWM